MVCLPRAELCDLGLCDPSSGVSGLVPNAELKALLSLVRGCGAGELCSLSVLGGLSQLYCTLAFMDPRYPLPSEGLRGEGLCFGVRDPEHMETRRACVSHETLNVYFR
jgi:hypothetical protein